jgi:hypothetical protein
MTHGSSSFESGFPHFDATPLHYLRVRGAGGGAPHAGLAASPAVKTADAAVRPITKGYISSRTKYRIEHGV